MHSLMSLCDTAKHEHYAEFGSYWRRLPNYLRIFEAELCAQPITHVLGALSSLEVRVPLFNRMEVKG